MSGMQNSPIPLSWSGRILYACVTIALPITSFFLAFDGLGPDWQSGRFSDYTLIMLGGTVSRIFYPFLAYSMVSILLLLISPLHYSKYFIVRFGIYTGIILSLQYAILLSISSPSLVYEVVYFYYVPIAIGIVLPLGINWLYSKAKERFGIRKTWFVIIGLILCFGLMLFIVRESLSVITLFSMVVILGTGPFWCLIIAILVSIRLLRDYELPQHHHIIGRSLGVLAWLFSFIIAWRIAISKTIEVYASLPEHPPNCYIATAAAKGHPRFVKSKPLVTGNGRTVWLNAQVKYFKCAELALMAMFPGGHKICRDLYDCVGTQLACVITHPILADMVYISLKPIEWGFKAMMRILVPDIDEIVHQVYTDVK
jgi:hypothetical protein